MSDAIEVIQLKQTDVSLMREICDVFGDAFEERDIYCDQPPSDSYVESLLGSEFFIAVAARIDGITVGGLTAYELRKPERETSEFYIYDLAVAEAHRRKGVATQLIGKVKDIAGGRGAWVIYIQADEGDEPAIRLYSSLGKKENVFHFDIAPSIEE